MQNALITDSGGMQKEAYWLQKKCITIRTETEWVETLEDNWNTLLFEDLSLLQESLNQVPKNWDVDLYGSGNAAETDGLEYSNFIDSKKILSKFLS